MVLHVPIGIDDFRKVRELGLEYVDETHLIRGFVIKAQIKGEA